jgi:hypothetical protein
MMMTMVAPQPHIIMMLLLLILGFYCFVKVSGHHAFIIPTRCRCTNPHSNAGLMTNNNYCRKRRRRGIVAVVLNSNSNTDGTFPDGEDVNNRYINNNDDEDDDEIDDKNYESLHYELSVMKRDMFGMDIPSNDELMAAAQNSENDFLAAMLEQTQQFQQIKVEEGSERACQVFMERIQADDEANINSISSRVDKELDAKGSVDEFKEQDGNDIWQ